MGLSHERVDARHGLGFHDLGRLSGEGVARRLEEMEQGGESEQPRVRRSRGAPSAPAGCLLDDAVDGPARYLPDWLSNDLPTNKADQRMGGT